MKKRIRAALISFFIPGGGQIYRKRLFSGLFFIIIFTSSIFFLKVIWRGFHPFSYFIFFSYLILWIVNIIDAYKGPFYFNAPCDSYCPAEIKPSIYISLLSEEKGKEALNRIFDTVPFPGTLGRICTAPCEKPCSRSGIDESIRIRYLKRLIFDYEHKEDSIIPIIKDNGQKVAIIGGGVAGVTCGYNLRKKGHKVVIFEREETAGGILLLGIPDYRLPKWVVEKEISHVKKTGVEIRTKFEIGKDKSFKDLQEEFDAIFIATGIHICNKLKLGEEKLNGVYYGLSFLKLTKYGSPPSIGKETVVIGGGYVGLDVALTALRLGSKVSLISLEKREEMPAKEEEINEAIEEGINIKNCWGVSEILGETNVKGVKLKFCQSVYDEKGDFNPTFDENINMEEKCDTLVVCIGQLPELEFLPGSIIKEDKIIVDKGLRTPIPGVFAGGDVRSPSSVVDAIGDGKRAARSIDLYLRGFQARLENLLSFTEYPIPGYPIESALKEKEILTIPLKGDATNFEELEGKCPYEEGLRESRRCLKCPIRYGNF